jgi:NTE family protein
MFSNLSYYFYKSCLFMSFYINKYIVPALYNNLPESTEDDSFSKEKDILVKNNISLDYQYLVFSGGGIKGIAYCGALDVLDSNNILYQEDGSSKILGFAGTSAGSIIAALLAVGYKTKEIKKILKKLDMRDLIDDKIGIIRDGINLIEKYGTAPGNYVLFFLGNLIKAKTGNEDYTIDQLYNDKGIKLVIVGTNMNMCTSQYFYPGDASNITIRKAVRISISIPFLFEPVLHDENFYVDGGVLDNYPLHVFDGEYPGEKMARCGTCNPHDKVLGLQIVTDDGANEDGKLTNREKIDNLLHFGFAFLKTFMLENDRRMLTCANKKRTVRIITPNYPTTNFTISDDDKNLLMECGRKCTSDFFDAIIQQI